jgi:nicotinate-nucleotide adenylyltransferase
MNEPVGILGGTFDPVHLAHLALARTALERLGLSKVIWIPAGHPPHRAPPLAAPQHRLAMVRLAIAGEPRFELDASEVDSTAASYTVHTLERLRRELGPERPLVLLMGADALQGLASWHRWRDLFALAHLGVATRPGYPFDSLPSPVAEEFAARRANLGIDTESRRPARTDFYSQPAGAIVPFELVAGTVSATEVRALAAAGADDARLSGLLPAPVLDYIRHNRLYCN